MRYTPHILVAAIIATAIFWMTRPPGQYRLGDYAVGVPYDGYGNVCTDYPGSLACGIARGRPLLAQAVARAAVTVVHVRTGDGLRGPNCFLDARDCSENKACFRVGGSGYADTLANESMTALYALPRSYYDSIHPPEQHGILIVGGNHVHEGAARARRDRRYIAQMKAYFEGRGYGVRTKYAGRPDDDFMLFARARTFVQGGGGFSGMASRLVTELGGTVLRSPNVSICGERHSLCVPVHRATRLLVTGASYNHAHVLVGMLRDVQDHNPTHIPVVVFDLGMVPYQKAYIQRQFPFVTFRTFEYEKYPSWFNIDVARGEYAWKPVIIGQMKRTADSVLWLDAGCGLRHDSVLEDAFTFLEKRGFITTLSPDTIGTWAHPKTRAALASEQPKKRMCAGGIVGFSSTPQRSDAVHDILDPWVKCAMQRSCIAPEGSSRANHRQDQAALTVLAWKSGFGCACPPMGWLATLAGSDGLPGISIHQDKHRKNINWRSGL